MVDNGNTLDVIAIGRSGIDLYGQQTGGRLEDMTSFAKYVGGSPTNTAIGAARLGLKTALLTRVGNDHMGRFIRERLEREGVDTRWVITDPDRLTALVILGIRDRDTFPLIFYRENCADMALSEDDVDDAFIASARSVLISGTHLSRPEVFAMSLKAVRAAKRAGRKVIFDIDYRPVLWGLTAPDAGENRYVPHEDVTARLQEIVGHCDLIVGTEEEFHILGGNVDTIGCLKLIRSRTAAVLVCKRGPSGCSVFDGAIPNTLDEGVVGQGFPVEVFNVLGAGDSFMGGFLRGWLRDLPLTECCDLGNAAGAIVVSRHGCAPAMPTWPEMQFFLKATERPHRLREWEQLEHIHWATTRHRVYDELTVLAFDHRSQFGDMVRDLGVDEARLPAFKVLALKAADKVAMGAGTFGILADGRYGYDALTQAADYPYWIGRPIELPGSRPLEFESSADVAAELAQWPADHVVKCLIFYHPDDEPDLRDRQERQVVRLADASRKTSHELLLEVIAPAGSHVDDMTTARSIQRFYDLGVKPDWWKLVPTDSPAAWANIEEVILRNDPLCRGVVLLGLAATEAELLASFSAAASCPIVKGFAVGRTVFNDTARAWLSGQLDDDQAVAQLAGRFEVLVTAWRKARQGGPVERGHAAAL